MKGSAHVLLGEGSGKIWGYFRLKLSPTSGCCPQWSIYFSKICFIKTILIRLWTKVEVRLGVPFLTFLYWKSALFCIFQTLPSVSKITLGSCWEKGKFIMINKFKYGQTWKIWPSPLILSLYSTFKGWNQWRHIFTVTRSFVFRIIRQ